jgi:subtilisin family serine protease
VEIVLRSDAADVAALAALPQVLHVGTAASGMILEDEASAQILAGNLSGTIVPPGYRQWLTERGIDGEGVTVSVVDSGVDAIHPDLAGRVVSASDRSVSPTGEPVDTLGHGTHVAGIVAGDGAGVAGTPLEGQKDDAGRLWGLGVAPEAKVVDQNALSTTASFALCGTQFWPPPPSGWEPITSEALEFEAVGWNASWHTCEGTGTGYTLSTSVLDGLVRDGDTQEPGAQPFSLVFSAGNSGTGTGSRLTVPHEGKNMITVASSDNVRGGGSPNNISSFSSRGFAVDGRVKPDVAAPGGSIVSTRSLPASAVCNQAPTPASQVLYATCSGTSMAAPHVTGALALVTQWWRKATDSDPSPAFAKAVLINSATDMGPANIPNRDEGWGRVNLGAAFTEDPRVLVDQAVVLTDLDQATSWTVTPADPTKPLRATVVWTDPAGVAGAERALVNDLDLEVVAPDGTTYVGNNFQGGRSVAGGTPNRIDNVENVFIDAAGAGTYTINVRAFNLPGDGVPFTGDQTDQDFALVISNAVVSA